MSETGFRPLFRNCRVPGKEPGLHSSLADVSAQLSSRENAGLQTESGCGCSTSSALALAAVRHTPVPGIVQLKGPLQAGPLMGLPTLCTMSMCLLGRPHSAIEDGGARGRFAKSGLCFSCLMLFWPSLKGLDLQFFIKSHPSPLSFTAEGSLDPHAQHLLAEAGSAQWWPVTSLCCSLPLFQHKALRASYCHY